MQSRVFLVVVLVVLVAFLSVEGAYKKPPFNGSIFGKRTSAPSDYEIVGRALSAMCEVASETCNAWMMHQDPNVA